MKQGYNKVKSKFKVIECQLGEFELNSIFSGYQNEQFWGINKTLLLMAKGAASSEVRGREGMTLPRKAKKISRSFGTSLQVPVRRCIIQVPKAKVEKLKNLMMRHS